MGSMSVKTCLGLAIVLLTLALHSSCGNFPLLDVDTNMRIVLVPHDTPVGGIIYRLRASDSDNNFPLSFEVLGALGKSLLKLNFLGCDEIESLCQADVVLKKTLDFDRTYEFQLQVKDTTGDYTKVHAAITATAGTANFNPLFAPRIIYLDESAKEGTVLDKFEVVKNELNSRTVHLELRDTSERIGLKQRLVSNNRTEGTLFLNKKLDYETEPWFTFQLLAMNGWTNTSIDTRNILISEIIVAIHDVQDTPPAFTLLPASVELNSSIKIGDLVAKIEAVDGDKQNKRLIRYGFLTDSNPFVVFFDLDPMSGEIRLRRNITELLAIAKPNEPMRMTIIAEEIITETGRFGRSTGSSLDRTMGNITFWFGGGSSFGPPVFSSNKYVGEVKENALPGTLVQFGMALRVSHQNPAEIINLSFSSGPSGGISTFSGGGNELMNAFQIFPTQGSGNFSFEIRVAGSTLLDYELYHDIRFMIMGSTTSGLFQEVEVTIHLRDENDNPPIFSQSEYHVELAEHSPIGTKVLQLQTSDKDTTGNYGQVVYSNLIGSDAFHLDPQTGEITVDKPELIDRELEPEIRLYVEAKDGGYTEFSDPNIIRNIATATIVIKLHDKNDNRPEFLQKYYQAVLNPEFTAFKTPLFVKAYDSDEGQNAQVKYQSLDPKFFVDPTSGEVRLRGLYNRNPEDGDGPYLGSFRIRAYDLGNPQQSMETVVQLFETEMLFREIQFVFPSSPEKIRKNQTSIEKMLSSLTGGIVGIQKITSITSRSNQLNTGSNNNGNGGSSPSSAEPTELPVTSRRLDDEPRKEGSRSNNVGGNNKKSEGLSSSDKSLVIATVQYPVSATPTRVDLAAFNKAYMGSSEPETPGKGNKEPDADMIKLYEAENRALFWILITFLLILLILFAIFLCCIYCPCCWLYGHCYSSKVSSGYRGGGDSHVERVVVEKRPIARHTRKTYPAEETEDSGGVYDREDPEASYTRRVRYGRKEAWSEDDDKGTYRRAAPANHVTHAERQHRPPTPRKRGRERHVGGGHVVRAPEGDVSLEDWEFEPNHPRISDRAEEIGPRWQQIQHQNQQVLPQPQTITVPVPLPLVPMALQHVQQHQQQQQFQQRRVGYVGHAHPGDDNFVRRPLPPEMVEMERRNSAGPGPGFGYVTSEMVPRNYPDGGGRSGPQSLPPAESARTPRQRQTRFFKTETGEVLQFAEEFEGDEGKELLMKRYIDEQQPHQQQIQHEQFDPAERSLRRQPTPGGPKRSHEDTDQGRYPLVIADKQSTTDRPRAAVVTKRSQRKGVKGHEIPEVDEVEEVEAEELQVSKEEPTKTTTKLSKAKSTTNIKKLIKQEGQQEEDMDEEYPEERDRKTSRSKRHKESEKKVKQRRSHSLSEEESDKSKSKSPSTKSKSKSRSKSPSPRKSKSQSPNRDDTTQSRSRSPEETKSKDKKLVSTEKESEEQQQQRKTRRHHHHHKRTTKHEKEDEKSPPKETIKETKTKTKKSTSKEPISEGIILTKAIQKSSTIITTTKGQKESQKNSKEDQVVVVVSAEEEEDNDNLEQNRNNDNANVDINIIPPSSAPMTDSSYSKDHEGPSPPETPDTPDGKKRKSSVDEEQGTSKTFTKTSTTKTSTVSTVEIEEESHEQKAEAKVQDENIEEDHQNDSRSINAITHHQEDDEDSGIGIVGVATSKRNKMLEKKSVFTIAYDEVAQKSLTIRPDTASNAEGEAELKSS